MSPAVVDYLGFLARIATGLVALAFVVGIIASSRKGDRPKKGEGQLKVRLLNDFYRKLHRAVEKVLLSKAELKALRKSEEKAEKKVAKDGLSSTNRPKVFVIDFKGDIRASGVESLRHEVTALLGHARKDVDEVVVRLESPGGTVDGYGLAASQLTRIREAGIQMTITIDNVAASGGYMMACIGNKVLSAPFAVTGSIGVVSGIPNVNRLLKKHDIDYEVVTAGQYKRTLTTFGENTEEGREKYKAELEAIHILFKGFVSQYRPSLDIDAVATGEAWFGADALQRGLVDEIQTSDEYLQGKVDSSDLIHLSYEIRKKGGFKERIGLTLAGVAETALARLLDRRVGM